MNFFFHRANCSNGLSSDVMPDTLNEETLAAMKEVQQMKENPHIGKTYTNVDDMMKDLLA